jgi:hypothetical protein
MRCYIGRNSSGFGPGNREYGRGDRMRWPRDIPYPRKLALTSPTSSGRSVVIVRLRTKATDFLWRKCLRRLSDVVERTSKQYEQLHTLSRQQNPIFPCHRAGVKRRWHSTFAFRWCSVWTSVRTSGILTWGLPRFHSVTPGIWQCSAVSPRPLTSKSFTIKLFAAI